MRKSAGRPGSAETEFEHEAYYETVDGALGLDVGSDNGDVLALQEYVAATGDNMRPTKRGQKRDSP